MKLWRICTPDEWAILQANGVIHANPAYAEEIFLEAYRWMVEQMEIRVGPRPLGVELPLWSWYQYDGDKGKRPDLRRKAHMPTGERGVRLELALPDERVLLSDFDLWHYVLNVWYLAASEQDADDFEAELAANPLPNAKLQHKIETSWQRIFDLDWQNNYSTFPRAEKMIQATFWELRLEDVKTVTHFVAR